MTVTTCVLIGNSNFKPQRTEERSHREELRCVLAVIRHGDRTPKQKYVPGEISNTSFKPKLFLSVDFCDVND